MRITRDENRLVVECDSPFKTMRVEVLALAAEILSIGPDDPFLWLVQWRLDVLAKELAETRTILKSKHEQSGSQGLDSTDCSSQ